MVGEKVDNYLKTRRGVGKDYTREIIKILLDRRYNDADGWVRAKEIRGIFDSGKWNSCSDQTLFRLLKDLTSEKIIERWEKNGNTVFYRVPINYPMAYFLSRKELIDHLKKSYDGLVNVADKLMIAKKYLKELGVSNPDAEIEARYQSWEVSRKLAFKYVIKKGIEDGSISSQPAIITPDDDVATHRFL
jgi:hypothetical protein